MTTQTQRYERWQPIAGLPEAPLGDFDASFVGSRLSVNARYAFSGIGGLLRIKFGHVEAFKAYEEFSDPWMTEGLPLPQLTGPDTKWRWPFQEVMGSAWIARVCTRNGGLDGSWRHLVISTMDFSLHVMTSSEPESVDYVAG